MKFYRVCGIYIDGLSLAFYWFTNANDAAAKVRELIRDTGSTNHTVDIIHINPTKKGILDALRSYANHPDNG